MPTQIRPEDARALELYRSVLSYAQYAVSIVVLLNGGALIGILSFLGNSSNSALTTALPAMRLASVFFVIGLIAAALGGLTAYMAQFTYFKEMESGPRPFLFSGTTWRVTMLILLFVSTILFAVGSVCGIFLLPV